MVTAATVTAACIGAVTAASADTVARTTRAPAGLLPVPPSGVTPLLDQRMVDRAIAQLDGQVKTAMDTTGVPGVAVAVVYHDRVVYARGFGVRKAGTSEPVDQDTVFQLASVSKPLSSTIVAGVVGRGTIKWDDPVANSNPAFALNDPYVTKHATFADLLSHRSGLSTGAGDLLEDLHFNQDYIFAHLAQQPLSPFRSTYAYSNFGFTEGAVAAAIDAGLPWAELADQTLFGPLGMTRSSYRHSDYEQRSNRAVIHVQVGDPAAKTWEATYVRDADAEAPAGGASSSVRDMTQFLRLQLGQGNLDGQQVIDQAALQTTHVPQQKTRSPEGNARTQFYGLGWNVDTDEQGRVAINHSGAFALGAATNVAMLPSEGLGIVTLTNGAPLGIPEAVNNAFFDTAQHGAPTVDWLGYYLKVLAAALTPPPSQYAKPPAQPSPAQPAGTYVGDYDNSYYGPLTVTDSAAGLAMTLGPADQPTTLPLTHYSGDTFTFDTIGENAAGLGGAVFTAAGDGQPARVVIDFYNQTGLGTFNRR